MAEFHKYVFSSYTSRVTLIISITFFVSVFLVSFYFPVLFSYSADQPQNLLTGQRIAVCLVGGARRFELTGPSIIDRLLRVYPNTDLFLNSPFDSDSYKLYLLNRAPSIAAVKIFNQQPIPETETISRVLGRRNNQGLLQYFNLVEGCLTLINDHQDKHNFTYDWIIRTRVDGYWSDPLGPDTFNERKYTIPDGSNYGGLNDRFGVGDYNTSVVALSRLSSLPRLEAAGFSWLFSETAYQAQFTTLNVQISRVAVPFCIVTDHAFQFPTQVAPVVAMSNPGAQNGSYCRPCTAICVGSCLNPGFKVEKKVWRKAEWKRDRMEICDSRGGWENGWEKKFDEVAGKKYAGFRMEVQGLSIGRCIQEFEIMKNRSSHWDGPTPSQICKKGL